VAIYIDDPHGERSLVAASLRTVPHGCAAALRARGAGPVSCVTSGGALSRRPPRNVVVAAVPFGEYEVLGKTPDESIRLLRIFRNNERPQPMDLCDQQRPKLPCVFSSIKILHAEPRHLAQRPHDSAGRILALRESSP